MKATRIPALLASALLLAGYSMTLSAASLLSGRVQTAAGPVEGVLIRATDQKGAAVSVFSRADGAYVFPDNTLQGGRYRVDIRAAGYRLASATQIDLKEGEPKTLPLRLLPESPGSRRWTNGEWISAAPSSDDVVDQRFQLNLCTHCHDVERVLKSTLDQQGIADAIARMSTYAEPSVPGRLVLRPTASTPTDAKAAKIVERGKSVQSFHGPFTVNLAKYISSVNLSSGRRELAFTPQSLPLPKGKATHAIIRPWTLPRPEAMPHDVEVDTQGIVWYHDFGAGVIGRLDPATGVIREFELPTLKADAPQGSLGLRVAPDGAIWVGMQFQGGVARFDPKTESFQTWSIPKENSPGVVQVPMVAVERSSVDGKSWASDAGIGGVHRIDLKTGAIETFRPHEHPGPTKGTGFLHAVYGIASDSHNNLFFLDCGESTTSATSHPASALRLRRSSASAPSIRWSTTPTSARRAAAARRRKVISRSGSIRSRATASAP